MITRQLSKMTPEPHAMSKYAEVWRGQMNLGDCTTDVCIKTIKVGNIHKVSEPLPCSG